MPEPNHPSDHCEVSSEEPLNSESKARFQGPGSLPTGCGDPDTVVVVVAVGTVVVVVVVGTVVVVVVVGTVVVVVVVGTLVVVVVVGTLVVVVVVGTLVVVVVVVGSLLVFLDNPTLPFVNAARKSSLAFRVLPALVMVKALALAFSSVAFRASPKALALVVEAFATMVASKALAAVAARGCRSRKLAVVAPEPLIAREPIRVAITTATTIPPVTVGGRRAGAPPLRCSFTRSPKDARGSVKPSISGATRFRSKRTRLRNICSANTLSVSTTTVRDFRASWTELTVGVSPDLSLEQHQTSCSGPEMWHEQS
jgi:hypothetical protein